ncbi:SIR2 family protein [Comamonas sp. JC664]|uniref:SIR2 family protein n=1 Tax=Comamonas sp. JC664 TaxID=2801917 RepID=UPI001748444A|nr:SIR2 family protein [Comamonas sp. JC664]MBL0696727.1 SIR2 family protein [Comamonas sp. JC664]GHH02961.1 hypothetical protein GCM10012319_71520 [Comamonas sp. KCTC 72670]
MTSSLPSVFSSRALLSAIHNAPKPIAILVGSPLTAPESQGTPGVPGVDDIIKLVRAAIERNANDPEAAIADLDSKISNAPASGRYQCAMDVLVSWTNQDRVNEVVREAVRMARYQPDGGHHLTDIELSRDNAGWHLPPGVRDLGELVTNYPDKYRGPILTTNFDSLISIAIERAGGTPATTSLDIDGRFSATQTPTIKTHEVVHLHGSWLRGDTLHTRSQLTLPRPQLASSLRRILQNHTLLVVAYGGWDDVFTRELASLVEDDAASVEILWAAFDSEPYKIAHHHAPLLERTRNAQILNRFRMYGGIDCRTFFGELLATNHGRQPAVSSSRTAIVASPPPPPVQAEPTRSAIKREAPESASRDQTDPTPREATKQSSSAPRPQPSGSSFAQRFIRMAAASMIMGSAAVIAFEVPLPHFLTNATPTSSPHRQAPQESDFVRDIKALRDRNRVRELTATYDGTNIINMPTGTFGFAPAVTLGSIRSASIHRTQPVNSFELHRLRNGAHVLLGFASSPVSETLERGTATAFEVSPVPTTTLKNLVMIPVERIRSAQLTPNIGQLSVKLDLAPAPPRRR